MIQKSFGSCGNRLSHFMDDNCWKVYDMLLKLCKWFAGVGNDSLVMKAQGSLDSLVYLAPAIFYWNLVDSPLGDEYTESHLWIRVSHKYWTKFLHWDQESCKMKKPKLKSLVTLSFNPTPHGSFREHNPTACWATGLSEWVEDVKSDSVSVKIWQFREVCNKIPQQIQQYYHLNIAHKIS